MSTFGCVALTTKQTATVTFQLSRKLDVVTSQYKTSFFIGVPEESVGCVSKTFLSFHVTLLCTIVWDSVQLLVMT